MPTSVTPTYPLLVFPTHRTIQPKSKRGGGEDNNHYPTQTRQISRIEPQLQQLRSAFEAYQGTGSLSVSGMEPEAVLVLEIAGRIEDFKQAIDAVAGLEWMAEWDVDDIPADEDFSTPNQQALEGRVFVSMSNQAGLEGLLRLWEQWKNGTSLPKGQTQWRDVFAQLRTIRRWGMEESLRETGMIAYWKDLLDPLNPEQIERFQIEFFYRQDPIKRRQNVDAVTQLLANWGGKVLCNPVDMLAIGFHAIKAEMPAKWIHGLLQHLEDSNTTPMDVALFKFASIMYFRPTGQSLAFTPADDTEVKTTPPLLPTAAADEQVSAPVVALLDGMPQGKHSLLQDRIEVDDAFDVAPHYQPGERQHGTCMASLIIWGDLSKPGPALPHPLYCIPIMQANAAHDGHEHVPDEVFLEDRIHRAVRRMFVGAGADVGPQAPTVRIINLSIGDQNRPFIHTPSPLARLLDWLSWQYRVLFCVSAGNFGDPVTLDIPHQQFRALSDDEKIQTTLSVRFRVIIYLVAVGHCSRRERYWRVYWGERNWRKGDEYTSDGKNDTEDQSRDT